MADEFKTGDVVELKSGGPEMTIESLDDFGAGRLRARCVWFEKNKRNAALFELPTLKKVTE
jgi:uncharacterized protein YodC (DUF2158 family)